MIEDQRFAAARPDVLVYRTEPLTEDVTVAGPILASIFASTSGTDADWIVKLIDVYPGTAPDNRPNPRGIRMGDFQMLLAGEVFRGRYRNSFFKPEALVPNQPVKPVTITQEAVIANSAVRIPPDHNPRRLSGPLRGADRMLVARLSRCHTGQMVVVEHLAAVSDRPRRLDTS